MVELNDPYGEESFITFCEDADEIGHLAFNLKEGYSIDSIREMGNIVFDYTEFLQESGLDIEFGGQESTGLN